MNPQSFILRRGDEQRRAFFAMVAEAELCAPATQPEAFLSKAEQIQFGGLRFVPRQQGFLLGRLAAKCALGALLAEPDLRNIEIRNGVFGQPLVRHARAEGIDVTVSHSDGVAVALAYPGEWPIGVDLETVSMESTDTVLGELGLSAVEQAWLAAGGADRATACGVLWSAREALGKSMKIGLNCPLGILALGAITPPGGGAWTGTYANFPQSRWLSQALDGRVLSIALPREVELDSWPQLR